MVGPQPGLHGLVGAWNWGHRLNLWTVLTEAAKICPHSQCVCAHNEEDTQPPALDGSHSHHHLPPRSLLGCCSPAPPSPKQLSVQTLAWQHCRTMVRGFSFLRSLSEAHTRIFFLSFSLLLIYFPFFFFLSCFHPCVYVCAHTRTCSCSPHMHTCM